MYNPLLDTFLITVDCGSFNAAAKKLYLSPTAVMKQINTLENQLGLSLVRRTRSGIQLTPGGKIIYQGALFLKDYSAKTLAEARSAMAEADHTFCVGTSLLNPAKPFMDLWYQYNAQFADYKLHLVPFEDNHEGILSEIGLLGRKFDFLIGVCDSRAWLSMCEFLQLGYYRKMIAVSRSHPLAKKKVVEVSDLHGQTLMMVPQGDSGTNDFIRHDLSINHPEIQIEDTSQYFDLSVFNRCAESNKVLLTIECWKDVHPGLVTIPVNWKYRIPYGLLYSADAPEDVKAFVETVRKNQPDMEI
ncbi:LysR family transcriptional regulator [Catenisphaera adipataccumulans]|jgi:DNA-binding transcriptional LysR family regulator|uniref:DNA-binding transcriptional LysR family regulator n=1 Tax=Catenisphaera adipataccumulans TaxID=700500 RepID=A0A7W8CZS5_9FIRM|nr:LysR family transcriptional regulator [Catenisphaera adipataccumulans]MBB5182960.1 DNA-binding transcriptional LysR family regulator [Catenisphaera adipataccumulans]